MRVCIYVCNLFFRNIPERVSYLCNILVFYKYPIRCIVESRSLFSLPFCRRSACPSRFYCHWLCSSSCWPRLSRLRRSWYRYLVNSSSSLWSSTPSGKQKRSQKTLAISVYVKFTFKWHSRFNIDRMNETFFFPMPMFRQSVLFLISCSACRRNVCGLNLEPLLRITV